MFNDLRCQEDVDEDEEDSDDDGRNFFRGEAQRQQRRHGDQPADLAVLHVAPNADDDRECEEGDVDVVAREAAKVEERRRNCQHAGRHECADRSELAAQQEGQPYERNAKEGGEEPGCIVVVTQDDERGGGTEVLKRTMRDRVV